MAVAFAQVLPAPRTGRSAAEGRPYPFQPGAVDAEIAASEARRRTHVDHAVLRVEQEFDVIDEVQRSRAELGMQVSRRRR